MKGKTLMPTPTISEAVRAAAEALSSTARQGGSIRASLSTQNGIADVFASFAPYSLAASAVPVKVEGLTYNYTSVKDSPTPAKKVAEKAQKPEGVVLTPGHVDVGKYAVKASLSLEQLLSTNDLERIIGGVLLRQCITALDADISAALAAATATTTTDKGSKAVLAAIANLLATGARPSHIAVNPADWAAILGEQATGSGYINMSSPETGPVGTLFGLTFIPSAAVPAKTAFVYDQAAVVVAEHTESPLLFMSPMSDTNESLVIVDLVAAPVLAVPGAATKVVVAA
jgi:HK97 family phage major capsid protein